MKEEYVLGIDIGGTNFRLGFADREGNVTKYKIESSHILLHSKKSSLETLVQYIHEFLIQNPVKELKGIAIGFPSTVSKDKTRLHSIPNIPLTGFEGVNIPEYIESRVHVPAYINKDVNLLLLCDMKKNKPEKEAVILGIYIGTGLGNSIYINGRFLDGKNGVAGELGHIPTLDNQELCGCGNEGCAETYASGAALQRLQKKFFPDTFIGDIFTKHSRDERILHFIEGLSIPVATEINILDPDYVIIGGGIPAMRDFPKKYLEECIHFHARKPYPANSLHITYSENRQESGVIGAGFYAFQKLHEKGSHKESPLRPQPGITKRGESYGKDNLSVNDVRQL